MLVRYKKLFSSGARLVIEQRLRRDVLHPSVIKFQYRYMSNEDLKKTLHDLNKKYTVNNTDDASSDKQQQTTDSQTDKEAHESKDTHQSVGTQKSPMDVLKSSYYFVVDNLREAYAEMMGERQESVLTRQVHQAQSYRPAKKAHNDDEDIDAEKEEKEEEVPSGPNAIVVVKEAKNAWEQMRDRLQDSPLIREILKNSRHVSKAALNTDLGKGAQNVVTSVQDRIEDVRNFWETSQNPIVYTLSGAWDNLTGETEEGIATKEIHKLDPKFIKEEWAEEVRLKLAPKILKAHLMGDTAALKPWLGEAVYNKLAADIRARKHDGIVFDSNILEIDENQIIMKHLESGSPVIVVVYMVQQINCIRNRKNEIIQGSETDVRAKFYSMAFQQHYDEDEALVKWRVVDYEFAGDVPYY